MSAIENQRKARVRVHGTVRRVSERLVLTDALGVAFLERSPAEDVAKLWRCTRDDTEGFL
jgi:hypothetical protein